MFTSRLKLAWNRLFPAHPVRFTPQQAFDLLADDYDSRSADITHTLDRRLISQMLSQVDLVGATVLDFGCGTSRNWTLFDELGANKYIGCDISPAMLRIARNKRPSSTFLRIAGTELDVPDHSIDLLSANLVLGYLCDLDEYFEEWCRALKSGAHVLITDFHPAFLGSVAKRTFSHNSASFEIHNYTHSLEKIQSIAASFGLSVELRVEQKANDDDARYFPDSQSFARIRNYPILMGLLLQRGKPTT